MERELTVGPFLVMWLVTLCMTCNGEHPSEASVEAQVQGQGLVAECFCRSVVTKLGGADVDIS